MSNTDVHTTQLILLLLLVFVTGFAALAQRLRAPYPIVLVIAGLLLGFVPGIPTVTLDPDVIFLVVTPPLVYAAAFVTSWRDFKRNLVSILMLAFGLVGFTVWAVASAGPWLFAGFDWRIGFVLGAAVATTDAIAATSIAKRIGLPKNIVDLLEGESLINDATGLLALEFATMIVVDGQKPTAGAGALRLLYLAAGAVGIGLVLGRIVAWFERWLDDGPIEIAVSILVPYAAYLCAEAIHTSGVLAVVAAGLYLGGRSSESSSPAVRIQRRAVWESFTFILNGLVFVLIGLQLPSVLAGVSELSTPRAILYGGLLSVLLIVLRLVWTFPGAAVAHLIGRVFHRDQPWPGSKQIFVVGWTGMRGVIALAAAMSLPQTIADGSPFPHRDLIVFLTFSVIVVTLVFQGLTLAPLIRLLRLAPAAELHSEVAEARRLVLKSTLDHLAVLRRHDPSGSEELYDDLAKHYEHRLASVSNAASEQDEAITQNYFRHLSLSRDLLQVERQTVLKLRAERRVSDEVLRDLEHELDLSETRLAGSTVS